MKNKILQAAVRLSKIHGYRNITRDQVAIEATVSAGTVNYHFETMEYVRRAVMLEAIKAQHLDILAQGMVVGDPFALIAPDELLNLAAESLKRRSNT